MNPPTAKKPSAKTPAKSVAKKVGAKAAAPKAKPAPKAAKAVAPAIKKKAVVVAPAKAKLAPKAAAPKPKAVAAKVVKPTPAKTAAVKSAPPTPKPIVIEINQPTGLYNGIRLAEAVKPFPKKTPYTLKELETLRKSLMEERDQLLREMASLNNTNREVMDLSKERPGYSLHMAEHATDLQTAEASMGVQSIVRDRLEEVETALKRIDDINANYGLCLACGAKIGIQRLMARPHAHLCMECRQRYERIRARRGY